MIKTKTSCTLSQSLAKLVEMQPKFLLLSNVRPDQLAPTGYVKQTREQLETHAQTQRPATQETTAKIPNAQLRLKLEKLVLGMTENVVMDISVGLSLIHI